MHESGELKLREWLIILVYFFFNSLFLPHGLLYTTILSPIFMYNLYQRGIYKYIYWFLLMLLPFSIQHFTNGVDWYYYLKSTVLLFTVVVTTVFIYNWAKDFKDWDRVMRRLVYWNLPFLMIAIIAYSTSRAHEWWWIRAISTNITGVARLKLLTYEASYYSLLLVPLVAYFVASTIIEQKVKQNIIPLVLLSVYLILSFSLGVIGGLLIALAIAVMFMIVNRWGLKKFLLASSALLITGILIGWWLAENYPDNMLVARVRNVIEGKDTSFQGRTFDSFYLANVLLDLKNSFWGVGPGQIKVLGTDFWGKYYENTFKISEVAIPNSSAETLAVFGYAGFIIRVLVEIVLFFTTRVYKNAFRLTLFIFIFIYQFTGSYLVNIAEYVIWILAFVPSFKQLDFSNIKKKHESTLSI